MEIIPRSEVPLRQPSAPLSPMPQPDGWIVHWVGSGGLSVAPSVSQTKQVWRNIQAESMNGIRDTKYIDIPYSFGLDPLGRILEGRGWDNKSAANGSANYNGHAWAVCYLAGPGMPLTQEAKDSLTWLTQEGARRAAAVSYVKPHSAIYATACPGPELAGYCVVLQARLHQSPVPDKVPQRFSMDFGEVVDTLPIPDGGAWVLNRAGQTFAVGRGIAPTVGGPAGHDYWGDRKASQLKRNGDGYTVVASTGEKYDFV